jgi:ribosomal protein S25
MKNQPKTITQKIVRELILEDSLRSSEVAQRVGTSVSYTAETLDGLAQQGVLNKYGRHYSVNIDD